MQLHDQMTWARERAERRGVRTKFKGKKLERAAGKETEKNQDSGALPQFTEDRTSRGRPSQFSSI